MGRKSTGSSGSSPLERIADSVKYEWETAMLKRKIYAGLRQYEYQTGQRPLPKYSLPALQYWPALYGIAMNLLI